MPFVASLPTWNRIVQVYRTVDGTAGNTFRGNIGGQFYCYLKRMVTTNWCPGALLYPWETALILHAPPQLPRVGGEQQFDVIVFPWPASGYDDGYFYAFIDQVSPRYDEYPNRHNQARLYIIDIDRRDLWFPDPIVLPGGTIDWSGPDDDGCSDCTDLPLSFDLLDAVSNGYRSAAPITWGCSPGSNLRWYINLLDLSQVAVSLIDDGLSEVYVTYEVDATGWDTVSPLVIPLLIEPTDVCVMPSSVTWTPNLP